MCHTAFKGGCRSEPSMRDAHVAMPDEMRANRNGVGLSGCRECYSSATVAATNLLHVLVDRREESDEEKIEETACCYSRDVVVHLQEAGGGNNSRLSPACHKGQLQAANTCSRIPHICLITRPSNAIIHLEGHDPSPGSVAREHTCQAEEIAEEELSSIEPSGG